MENYGDIQIKQHSKVKYLGCLLEETVSGEAMTLNVINKNKSEVKFLQRRIQATPYKCMCFRLQLEKWKHISYREFDLSYLLKNLNWLVDLLCIILAQFFEIQPRTHSSLLTNLLPSNIICII